MLSLPRASRRGWLRSAVRLLSSFQRGELHLSRQARRLELHDQERFGLSFAALEPRWRFDDVKVRSWHGPAVAVRLPRRTFPRESLGQCRP
jgi:hypothetical protein